MTMVPLANRKCLNEIFGLFVYAQIAINAIWRLTLRHVLKESLELKFGAETLHSSYIINVNKTILHSLLKATTMRI